MLFIKRLISAVICLAIAFACYYFAKELQAKEIPEQYLGKTEATITSITSYQSGSGKTRSTGHDVMVAFEANGKAYSGELDYYSSDMDQGEKVAIHYDTSNPGHFYSPVGNSLGAYLLYALSVLFLIMGLYFLLKRRRF